MFDTAFGQAKGSDFDTFQIDNHYARFLLESRIYDPDNFQDPFWALTEAHRRIKAQIVKEKNATHPYRVAELYPDFAEFVWPRLDAKQRAAARRMFVEMLKFLAEAPTWHREHEKTETIDRLSHWLEAH